MPAAFAARRSEKPTKPCSAMSAVTSSNNPWWRARPRGVRAERR
ncbi:hypothetical protein ACH4E7_43905 [Kitasatospora sp. NPDC018058]